MACRMVGDKLPFEPKLEYCKSDTRKRRQWNFNRYLYIFFQENLFHNIVWKMVAICLGLNVLMSCTIGDDIRRMFATADIIKMCDNILIKYPSKDNRDHSQPND